jgi:hypothetical protein
VSAEDLNDFAAIAAAVRTACLDAAIQAYEEAGIRGLRDEGRREYAIAAVRRLDLQSLKLPPEAVRISDGDGPTSVKELRMAPCFRD